MRTLACNEDQSGRHPAQPDCRRSRRMGGAPARARQRAKERGRLHLRAARGSLRVGGNANAG